MYIVLIDKSCIDVDMFYLLTELVRIINREILNHSLTQSIMR
jgi:hypothetical protein